VLSPIVSPLLEMSKGMSWSIVWRSCSATTDKV